MSFQTGLFGVSIFYFRWYRLGGLTFKVEVIWALGMRYRLGAFHQLVATKNRWSRNTIWGFQVLQKLPEIIRNMSEKGEKYPGH